MKRILLKFLVSKSGQWLKYPLASGLAVIGTSLARYGVNLSEVDQVAIVAWLTVAIPAFLNDLAVKWTGDATEQIQAAQGLKTDRYLGPVTVEASSNREAEISSLKSKKPSKIFGVNK